MVREDLVTSAVEFLRDPSVATSPVESRIAFLRSKNLTQQEIDSALARSGDGSSNSPQPPSSYGSIPDQQQIQRPFPPPPQQQQPYGPYQAPYWAQQQPPALPRRDWRDWFIMATVTSGLGYGLFILVQRYVLPLISPPTPPQLAQDKASIDASFTRAFNLLDQLAADTAALKTSETSRSEKLDKALADVAAATKELKALMTKREDEMARAQDEIRGLRALIPKALDGQKSVMEKRMKEVGDELKSLRTLVGTRMGAQNAAGLTPAAVKDIVNGVAVGGEGNVKGESGLDLKPFQPPVRTTSNASTSAFGRPVSGNRAAIPAWQMAASQKTAAEEEAGA